MYIYFNIVMFKHSSEHNPSSCFANRDEAD